MADIASAANVHRSTVSLALRHQSKIPAATRERILRIAESLGYTPDPLLDAFNFHRQAAHPLRANLVIAFLSDAPSRKAFENSALHVEAFRGAREKADRIGFSVDLFLTGPGQLSAARLDQVLQSRSITCVIVGALSMRTTELRLDWSRYCVVAIDSFHVQPGFDCVTVDHRASTRRLIQQLRQARHTRIGFVSSVDEDQRLAHLPLSGYLYESHLPGAVQLAPLLLTPSADRGQSQLDAWMKRHRPSALVTGCVSTFQSLQSRALVVPPDLVWYASGDAISTPSVYRELAAHAAELLPLRRQINQRGTPAHRTTTVVPR